MYDIVLTGMRSQFAHALESKALTVQAYNTLNAAVGCGLDVNELNMSTTKTDAPAAPESFRLSRVSSMVRDGKRTPIDACVDWVVQRADKAVKFDSVGGQALYSWHTSLVHLIIISSYHHITGRREALRS
jgi:hypothetical protein